MGDEFIVILPATDADKASMVAERLREAVERASKGWLFPTSISIGVAYYPKHGYTSDQLIEEAEKALRIAKSTGKNKVIVAG
jgi:diguanylate cyclase (GGDEF)-like protein